VTSPYFPRAQEGLRANTQRGCGLVFGPDVTEAFLSANGLRFVIRSHEGPDARKKREDSAAMGDMMDGWSVDHTTPAGRLATLFSAPDYPQFMAPGEPRPGNRAAFVVLCAPHYDEPEVTRFEAAPRPAGQLFYELDQAGSDEEGPGGAGGGGSDAE
jgi:serine/threonine-protein phosphatase 5